MTSNCASVITHYDTRHLADKAVLTATDLSTMIAMHEMVDVIDGIWGNTIDNAMEALLPRRASSEDIL